MSVDRLEGLIAPWPEREMKLRMENDHKIILTYTHLSGRKRLCFGLERWTLN
jgi:hypothetical protein